MKLKRWSRLTATLIVLFILGGTALVFMMDRNINAYAQLVQWGQLQWGQPPQAFSCCTQFGRCQLPWPQPQGTSCSCAMFVPYQGQVQAPGFAC